MTDEDFTTAGPKRRRIVLYALGILIALSAAISYWTDENPLLAAALIFVMSLATYSWLATITADCVRAWRSADYPWVLATFVSIVVALTNIAEARRKHGFEDAIALKKQLYSTLAERYRQYSIRVCEGKGIPIIVWKNPESPGSLVPIEGLLNAQKPKKEPCASARELSRLADETLSRVIFDPVHASGSQLIDYLRSEDIPWLFTFTFLPPIEKSDADLRSRLSELESQSWLYRLVIGDDLRYWYFTLAFLMGLRLSKTTAELLQARANTKRR